MTYQESEIGKVATQLLANAPSKVLCFYGAMGAGKTTLIKSLVQSLEGADTANSPTFGLVNEYHHKDGSVLGYHFDFYRIEDETEALDMGFEDYLNQDAWLFIEWPEKIPSFIPDDAVTIRIDIIDSITRKITF